MIPFEKWGARGFIKTGFLMSKKQKLELTWIGKDKRPRLEPRILLEDKALSYHAEIGRAHV
jgi:hypothetical protein